MQLPDLPRTLYYHINNVGSGIIRPRPGSMTNSFHDGVFLMKGHVTVHHCRRCMIMSGPPCARSIWIRVVVLVVVWWWWWCVWVCVWRGGGGWKQISRSVKRKPPTHQVNLLCCRQKNMLRHWCSVGYDCVTSGMLAGPSLTSEVTCPPKESISRTFNIWVVLSVLKKLKMMYMNRFNTWLDYIIIGAISIKVPCSPKDTLTGTRQTDLLEQ